MNNKLFKVTSVFAKVISVMAWVVTGILAVTAIVCLILWNSMIDFLNEGIKVGSVTFHGVTTSETIVTLNPSKPGIILCFIIGMGIMSTVALIFRAICQIFKSETPFAEANVAKIRFIGYAALILPVVKGILSFVMELATKIPAEETIELSTFVYGLIILCLAKYFEYGASLEKEVDGLV